MARMDLSKRTQCDLALFQARLLSWMKTMKVRGGKLSSLNAKSAEKNLDMAFEIKIIDLSLIPFQMEGVGAASKDDGCRRFF